MTIAAWVIASGAGLYAVALLIGRFAGSNSAASDDLTDEQLRELGARIRVEPLTDEQLQAIAKQVMRRDQA